MLEEGINVRRSQEYRRVFMALNPYAPGGSGTSASNAANPPTAASVLDPYGPTPHLGQPKSEQPQSMVFPGSDDTSLLDVFASPGYTSPKPQVNSIANTAAWVSALSIFFFPAIAAVILGIIGLVGSTSMNGVGRRASIAAIIAGVVGISIWFLVWMALFWRSS